MKIKLKKVIGVFWILIVLTAICVFILMQSNFIRKENQYKEEISNLNNKINALEQEKETEKIQDPKEDVEKENLEESQTIGQKISLEKLVLSEIKSNEDVERIVNNFFMCVEISKKALDIFDSPEKMSDSYLSSVTTYHVGFGMQEGITINDINKLAVALFGKEVDGRLNANTFTPSWFLSKSETDDTYYTSGVCGSEVESNGFELLNYELSDDKKNLNVIISPYSVKCKDDNGDLCIAVEVDTSYDIFYDYDEKEMFRIRNMRKEIGNITMVEREKDENGNEITFDNYKNQLTDKFELNFKLSDENIWQLKSCKRIN